MKSYQLTDGHEPMSWVEIDRLAELAQELPPNPLIVNIGAATGVSTCTFLEARPDARIYSIDVEICQQEFDNAHLLGLDTARVLRLLGDSKVIGADFDQLADMVFCDGDHWGAAGDIATWLDKVKEGGLFVFHDWQPVPAANNPGDVYEQVLANMPMDKQYGSVVDRVIAFKL
jgi:predicted O-methyltransferase YrrM